MSTASNISKDNLQKNCKDITCTYDALKGRVQATANDKNLFLAIGGSETRTIQYTWVSGWQEISIDLFHVTLFGSWSFIDRAEIYVDKELVATISGDVDRRVGKYNDVVGDHENIERITGYVSIEKARIISEANHEDVTIRFYGKDGYSDIKLPRNHKLINVVNLASL